MKFVHLLNQRSIIIELLKMVNSIVKLIFESVTRQISFENHGS